MQECWDVCFIHLYICFWNVYYWMWCTEETFIIIIGITERYPVYCGLLCLGRWYIAICWAQFALVYCNRLGYVVLTKLGWLRWLPSLTDWGDCQAWLTVMVTAKLDWPRWLPSLTDWGDCQAWLPTFVKFHSVTLCSWTDCSLGTV